MDRYADIEQKIKEILAKQLNMLPDGIKPQALLVEDLGLDSFGSVEVAFALEERFDLKIPDQDLYNAKTVKNIVDYINERTQNTSQA